MELKQGMLTVGEMKLVQEYSKTSDISVAIRLLVGRTGLGAAQIETLDIIEFQRAISQIASMITQSLEQSAAILAAEALTQKPDA